MENEPRPQGTFLNRPNLDGKLTLRGKVYSIGRELFEDQKMHRKFLRVCDMNLKVFDGRQCIYLRTIEPGAFRGTNVMEVFLPAAVNVIHSEAFACCKYLKKIVVDEPVQSRAIYFRVLKSSPEDVKVIGFTEDDTRQMLDRSGDPRVQAYPQGMCFDMDQKSEKLLKKDDESIVLRSKIDIDPVQLLQGQSYLWTWEVEDVYNPNVWILLEYQIYATISQSGIVMHANKIPHKGSEHYSVIFATKERNWSHLLARSVNKPGSIISRDVSVTNVNGNTTTSVDTRVSSVIPLGLSNIRDTLGTVAIGGGKYDSQRFTGVDAFKLGPTNTLERIEITEKYKFKSNGIVWKKASKGKSNEKHPIWKTTWEYDPVQPRSTTPFLPISSRMSRKLQRDNIDYNAAGKLASGTNIIYENMYIVRDEVEYNGSAYMIRNLIWENDMYDVLRILVDYEKSTISPFHVLSIVAFQPCVSFVVQDSDGNIVGLLLGTSRGFRGRMAREPDDKLKRESMKTSVIPNNHEGKQMMCATVSICLGCTKDVQLNQLIQEYLLAGFVDFCRWSYRISLIYTVVSGRNKKMVEFYENHDFHVIRTNNRGNTTGDHQYHMELNLSTDQSSFKKHVANVTRPFTYEMKKEEHRDASNMQECRDEKEREGSLADSCVYEQSDTKQTEAGQVEQHKENKNDIQKLNEIDGKQNFYDALKKNVNTRNVMRIKLHNAVKRNMSDLMKNIACINKTGDLQDLQDFITQCMKKSVNDIEELARKLGDYGIIKEKSVEVIHNMYSKIVARLYTDGLLKELACTIYSQSQMKNSVESIFSQNSDIIHVLLLTSNHADTFKSEVWMEKFLNELKKSWSNIEFIPKNVDTNGNFSDQHNILEEFKKESVHIRGICTLVKDCTISDQLEHTLVEALTLLHDDKAKKEEALTNVLKVLNLMVGNESLPEAELPHAEKAMREKVATSVAARLHVDVHNTSETEITVTRLDLTPDNILTLTNSKFFRKWLKDCGDVTPPVWTVETTIAVLGPNTDKSVMVEKTLTGKNDNDMVIERRKVTEAIQSIEKHIDILSITGEDVSGKIVEHVLELFYSVNKFKDPETGDSERTLDVSSVNCKVRTGCDKILRNINCRIENVNVTSTP